jgi:hypothetical protein
MGVQMSGQLPTRIIKVLIVDSNDIGISSIARAITDNLSIYDIYATNNTHKAISYMIGSALNENEAEFDFIVIGEIIGEMDRLALLVYIKSSAQLNNIKVIIMGRDKECINNIYLSNGAFAVVDSASDVRHAISAQ